MGREAINVDLGPRVLEVGDEGGFIYFPQRCRKGDFIIYWTSSRNLQDEG